MVKRLGILTKNVYSFYRLKKTVKPIGEIGSRMYRLDDALFISQSDAPNSILLYRQDSTQPLGYGEYLDPDMTKVFIDSLKRTKKKPSKFGDGFTINKAIPVIVIIAIIISVFYGISRAMM